MSIAQGTTHYSYPQVQLSDRPTFADFNPAFEDIDAKLYSLITGASTDHGAIEALQTGLGETNLLLASVKQTADSASGKANTNAENITLLQTALGNTDRTVANKLDSVAIAEPYDAAAGTYAVGDIVVYQGQRYKCTTAVAVAEPFDADKWAGEDVETVLEHLQDEIDNIPTPTAADVNITPITGMTATQTQQALEELNNHLVGHVVTVTGDGVKTYSQLLDELYNSLPSGAIKPTAIIYFPTSVFQCNFIDGTHILFTRSFIASSDFAMTSITLKSSSSVYGEKRGSSAYVDSSSQVAPNDFVITYKY